MAAESNLSALAEALGPCARRDVPLAPFTSIRVGGAADVFVVAGSQDELVHAVRLARHYDVPWQVLGSGCNVLIADEGVRGLVIANRAESIFIEGGLARAESGAKLTVLAQRAVEAGLEGLAWAAGLPGTVGGAVVGNAGAFEGDVAGVLGSATMLEPDDEVRERPNTWFEFRYRGSRLKGRPHVAAEDGFGRGEAADGGYVVLKAAFDLKPGNRAALRARAEEILTWRRTRHPSGATMGSTFKNPPGGHAGRLIERAGLKGLRIGGAQISEQHANFFVNVDDATAVDVWALIERARAEVRRQFGVVLELEIEPLGWDGSVMNGTSTKCQGRADGNG
ncbi:MAG: UDP-N-acetylmuramate dehydrogenase [Anaerolineae bacterium]